MGPYLGIFNHNRQYYRFYSDVDMSYYPSRPAMTSSQWQKIINYYMTKAPQVMPQQNRKKQIKRGLPYFELDFPPKLFYRNKNTASFIKVDTSVKPHRTFIHRAESNTFYLINNKLQVLDSLETTGPIVDMDVQQNKMTVCKIGYDLLGKNTNDGSIAHLTVDEQNNIQLGEQQPLFNDLYRPVHVKSTDLSGNHKNDYLISEFGLVNGGLLWKENKGNGKFTTHEIRPVAGAIKTNILDYNHDGLPDLWTLFGQGEEGIFLFTNKGNNKFGQEQVLQFPPTYGSTSFELVDFNKNGYPDILYTAGDRGDGIPQLKPYHGVYIFINNGNNEFTQQYFFPLNGAIKAIARDFDGDGNLDIAAIGLFTDSQQPEEGFIYLKNKGNFNFQPYSLPVEANIKRAFSMDAADIDNNGKLDLIIGNAFNGDKTKNKKGALFIVLKNTSF
ncbi:Repeat domain-containing protein [Fodinibius roseus]|uniref:Repeat domain-containing protein n=2 Tax=Fodinibius roseus TaxID=1194090 RepID=A0A1M5LX09_9BACT|nr:Repeat domain-containing protein [Fodinibius roseus]